MKRVLSIKSTRPTLEWLYEKYPFLKDIIDEKNISGIEIRTTIKRKRKND